MSQADTIGFGDGQNDFDMLRYCDVGVAMGNSSDEVKAVADIVTDDIKEDGLKNAWCILDLSKNAPCILYASIFMNLSHSHSSFDADTIKVYERSSVPSNTKV